MLRTLTLLFAAALVSAGAASLPVADAAPAPVTEAHLVRYAFDVRWSGASGRLPPQGQAKVMLQADLPENQQTLHLARAEDESYLARVLQAGTTAFVSPVGQETFAVLDLTLGTQALGFPVGLATALDWLQGRDASGPIAQARITRDAQGRPVTLEEDGWLVRYEGWADAPGTGYAMPRRVMLTRPGSDLRVDLSLAEAAVFDSAHLPEGYRPIRLM